MTVNSVKLKIRPYKNNDYQSVKSILLETGLFHENTDTKSGFKNKIRKDPGSILVAESKGKVIGNVITMYDGWNALIFRLAVRKELQGRGIGPKILNKAESMLRSKGAAQIVLLVRDHEEHLKRFYRKMGYFTSKVGPGSSTST